ncbi:ABC transporter permease [Puia dinghuensis]|uniref:ABC transporter permease n=1 Tax=Puia dinghuensis TaxID=1792502 RepID=A0A8J2XSW9_9BACT|nr:ABC transporter permease [Puia dinghuensis]GGA94185.1 ABC transporter permease [Puia dinghuensis]
MIINYFKIAWRNLMKSKIFSFINIFGLAAGLTCCMLISIYLKHELSYDAYQKDVKDLYEVATVFQFQHKDEILPATPWPMGPTLQRDFPEVEHTARLLPLSLFEDKTMLEYRQGSAIPVAFYEDKGFLADSTFFRLFTYHFIEGDPGTALDMPAAIVVSEEIAHKLFGAAPAVGKVIHVSSGMYGDHVLTVKGVFRPMKAPSHIAANFFMSMKGGDMDNFYHRQENDFATNNMFVLYLKLKSGTSPAALEAQLPAFIDKYAGKDLKVYGYGKREMLVPVRDVHLRSDIKSNVTPPGSKAYLYILASIAVFTLLIACINFMNLATARSAKRSSEVGIRKVLGAVKGSLIGQFLGESVLMSIIAFGLAWAFTVLLLPAFSMMTARNLSFTVADSLPMLAGFLALAVFAGLLAGLYPAFYLSSFQPAKVLKGKFSNSLAAASLRKGLVIFQFIISVTLIVSTVVINDQMKFLRSQDLGFNKESQIVIPLRGSVAKEKCAALETEFKRNSSVLGTGGAAYYPGIINPSDNMMYKDGDNPQTGRRVQLNYVDYDYSSTLGLQMAAGRLFSRDFPADSSGRIILNESAVKAFGFATPQAAIGAWVNSAFQGMTNRFEVIGVVRDFHFEDLHTTVAPYALLRNRSMNSYLIVHARPGAPGPLLSSLGAAWHKVDPDEPFEYSFLDEDFQKNYAAEERLSAMIGYFTVMAILISCLGLFGLASFSAEQRIREIGIRKVLGASVAGIVMLLSKDFLKLVGIAMVIASPVAWMIMHQWLQDFAYRVPIDWMVFAVTFVSTLLITLVTIGFQAVRAGMANPVQSLKME